MSTLFGRFRLDASTPLYSSRSTTIYPCTDLEAGGTSSSSPPSSSPGAPLLIKLGRSEQQWRREWAVHKDLAGGGGAAAVVPLAAACCVSSALCGDAPPPAGATIVSEEDRDGAPTAAKQLMTQFPFGVVMHRADISLAEAAHQFELARSPLTELRCIAQHIAGTRTRSSTLRMT